MCDKADSIDERKQDMRHEAIRRRKETEVTQRAEAGVRLGRLAESLLNNLPVGFDIKSSTRGIESVINDGDKTRSFKTNSPTLDLEHGDSAAAYVSMGTEVPTLELLDELNKCGLRVLVPRLGKGRDIGWSEYAGKTGLREMPHTAAGGLRPAEPEGKTLGPEAIAETKLVFIPAFAIDLDGTRLGRGGGWYDQVLALCRTDTLKIGVCWDWEFIDRHRAVPRESHDIPVDTVMTPERLIRLE